MKKIVAFLRAYFVALDKKVFFFSTVFTALLVFINYQFGLNKAITRLPVYLQYLAWYVLFFIAFLFGYWVKHIILKAYIFRYKKFWLMYIKAKDIYSLKMVFLILL